MDPLGHLSKTSKHKRVVSHTTDIADAVKRYPKCPE